MNNRRLDLGLVSSLRAETFGEPGHRTFRLLPATAEGQVSLWLEKEQVVILGSAIHDLLDRLPSHCGSNPSTEAAPSFIGELEVKVGSLALRYDVKRDGFTLEAADFTAEPAFELAGITLLATREQLAVLGDEIDEIVSGSRPRCRLCGTPLTGDAHFCPESNGHAELTIGE